MSVALNDLVARLQAAIPTRDNIPTVAQYQIFVKDAVRDVNRDAPLERVTTLNVVYGTASYALPIDFLKVVRFAGVVNPSGVIVTDVLIPVNAQTWQERYTVAGRTLTLYPTPTYSLARELWYASGHVLDTNNNYPDMTEDVEQLVMMRAKEYALTAKADYFADNSWEYEIGDESVDKTEQVKAWRAQAKEWGAKYASAIAKVNGAVGMRADYTPSEYGSFA